MTEKAAISYLAEAVMLMTNEQIKEFDSKLSIEDRVCFMEKGNKEAVRKLVFAHEI